MYAHADLPELATFTMPMKHDEKIIQQCREIKYFCAINMGFSPSVLMPLKKQLATSLGYSPNTDYDEFGSLRT